MRILITLLVLIGSSSLFGQFASGKMIPNTDEAVFSDFKDLSLRLSTTINSRDLKNHIFTLADDSYEGRETGHPGNDKAAQYIAAHFKKLGLKDVAPNGNYFQTVAFTFSSWQKIQMTTSGDEKWKFLRDYLAFPQYSIQENIKTNEITFVGYGIESDMYSDYDQTDLNGKVLIAFDDAPRDEEGKLLFKLADETYTWKKKSEIAKKKGAKALIIIANDLKTLINDNRRQLVNRVTQLGDFSKEPPSGVNTIFVSSTKIAETIGDQTETLIEKRMLLRMGERVSMITPFKLNIELNFEPKKDVLLGQNVMGLVEGTDKKDEVVIVSAHYDHVGKKGEEVYNGADANASGTTTVLEIAEALATAKKMNKGPRRSILCLLVTGEEKGLLGSDYYSENPVFKLENTVADVNIDMVGRWGEEYADKKQDYIYVIGSDRLSQDLHDVNEEINQKYSHLLLDYKYNDEKDPNRFYFRSDHYNFAKHGIPSIFFFNGVHEDYHRLTDTPDKIDIETMKERARHIFHLVWNLSNRKERIRLSEPSTTP